MSQQPARERTTSRKTLQRERILAAAQACFAENGFHAASMATIAETAGVSPGLIYRYFENKNAIILAIIDKQLMVVRRRIRELHSTEYLAKRIVDYFDEPEPQDEESMNTALFLEISAQGARDPQIAQAMERFDSAVRSELTDWLRRSPGHGGCGLDERIAPLRALLLLSLIEGLKIRGARGPDVDRARLRRELDRVLQSLVEPLATESA
jgi:TetR/AcrR family transcriptional repressor of uid operon